MTAYPIESLTPEQMRLIEDRSRVWHQNVVQASDSVATSVDGYTVTRKKDEQEGEVPDGTVIPAGWDHEHCAICWQTLSSEPEVEQSGYTDGKEWLCVSCYEKLIVPRVKES